MQQLLLDLISSEKSLSHDQISRFYNNREKCNNVFVINMANRHDRLETCNNTLKKIELNFERFVAINGKQLIENTEIGKELHKKFFILTPGELGCLLSHLCLLALMASHPKKNNYTLVFEDDIVTSTQGRLNKLFDEINELDYKEGIDIVYLGKCMESCTKLVNIKDHIFRAVGPMCAHALMIKNSYARKILEDLDNCSYSAIDCNYFNRAIDSIYGDYILKGISNGLVIHPAIFYQDVLTGGSDLRKDYLINYQECNDTNPWNCPPREKEKKSGNVGMIILIIIMIILIIVIIVLLLIMYNNKYKIKTVGSNIIRRISSKITTLIVVIVIVLIIIVILIIKTVRKRKNGNKKKKEEPNLLKDFKPCPSSAFPIRFIEGSDIKSFNIDSSSIANKDYNVSTPNGIVLNGNILTTAKSSNGIVSYPLMQIFNYDLSNIYMAKKVMLKSNKIIISKIYKIITNKIYLGFEDMRVFRFNNDIYLIGVNSDRREDNIPSMILVKLNHKLRNKGEINEDTWHLNYDPIRNLPNKNWSPLTLQFEQEELGFIVDIDPLLIIKRFKNGDRFLENCEIVYSAKKQTNIEKLRNSTITYSWKDVPSECRCLFEDFIPYNKRIPDNVNRYVLMGHNKYVEADYVQHAWSIIYQHYFVVIDINPINGKCKVYTSKPFHIEEENKPHIEYVSGFCFRNDQVIIFYGLKDKECKYIQFTANRFHQGIDSYVPNLMNET